MKKTVKWVIVAVLLVGIIAGATVLYNILSKEYGANNLEDYSQTSENTAADEKTEETAAKKNTYAAADFTVLDYDGNEVSLSDFRGKPVVLNFWATWCYYCKMEMPDFDDAYSTYPDVQFLMVNATDGVQETMEAAKKYVENEGYRFDVFFDTQLEAVNAYHITGFPSTYFIDKDGNIVTRNVGMIDYETLEKGINMIRGEE